MVDKNASLSYNGSSDSLPIYSGTIGPEVIDINTLGKTGAIFTYDPGFVSTAACESKITFIDGDKGILLYRGYPIEQLAEKCNYMKTCYLLMFGELPTPSEYNGFVQ